MTLVNPCLTAVLSFFEPETVPADDGPADDDSADDDPVSPANGMVTW